MKPVTAGADIEFFIKGGTSKEANIVPCVGIIPGRKGAPWRPPRSTVAQGIAMHEDNVMLEFNVPVYTRGKLTDSLQTMRAHRRQFDVILRQAVQHRYKLQLAPFAKFSKKALDSSQAQSIGCEPDNDAYTNGEVRRNPDLVMFNAGHRSAGGHIHIGGAFKCPHFVVALFCDLYLGLSKKANCYNTGPFEWYRRPGIYRDKPYGIEYRTLSNEWAHTPATYADVMKGALRLGNLLVNTDPDIIYDAYKKVDWGLVRKTFTKHATVGKERQSSWKREVRSREIHKCRAEGLMIPIQVG